MTRPHPCVPLQEKVFEMRRSFRKALFGGALALGTSWALVLGCSSKSNDTPETEDASLTCPRSLTEAIGASCPKEGQVCGIGYPCGSFQQQATCTCGGGKFACTDATGTDVAAGAQPACVGPGQANDKECPSTEVAAAGKACKTSGLLCYYTGALCPENSVPTSDFCQCLGATGGGLQFNCEPRPCNPRGDASDLPDTAPVDTGTIADAHEGG
jgi:hypothetical protein